MLILILVTVQYLQNVVLGFKKGPNHSLSDSRHLIKSPPLGKFPIPLPLNAILKTLNKGTSLLKFVCLFQVKFNFSTDNCPSLSSFLYCPLKIHSEQEG